MATRPVTLLLVEDNAEDTRLIQEALAQQRHVAFTLVPVSRLSDGAQRLSQGGIDLVLLDLTLPDSKGLETLVHLKARAGETPIVILTASDDDDLAVQALQKGAQDYLVKGFIQVFPDMLGRAVSYAIERHRAEESAASAHAETQQLLSSISSILIGVSSSGLVTHWNAVAEATFGVPAAQTRSRPLAECRVRWDTVRILQGLADCSTSGHPSRVDDVAFTRLDGREGYLGVTIIPVRGTTQQISGFLLFGADVTERKEAEAERARLQEQLVQAQKMETIGRFAGGIAHDFNNFLQVILGFAWLIRAKQREDRELISDLQEIVHAAESASAMVRQLLAFSRQQPLQPVVFEINGAVRGMARLLQQFVGEHIHLELALAEGALGVKLDRAGLEQILMNLCANARDAMQERGTLTVRTEHRALRGPARSGSAPLEGEYVRLSVKDSGPGMDPKVAAHIFEPFFTTKQVGKGTGLGLAVVYGLVQQHGGHIEIETALGHGTTFHLSFPLQALTAAAPAPADAASARVEMIFVVEHDARQRALVEEVLRETGYRVLAAGDGAEAVRLYTQHGGEIDAVLLDVSLPDMPSQDVLARIRQARPQARILLVGSYLDRHLRAMESSLGARQTLHKPYVPAQLLDEVRHLLSQPPAGTDGAVRRRVLVVDDEPAVLVFCERALKAHHDITTAPSGREAVEALRRSTYDVLLTDVRMPEMSGLVLIDEAVKLQPQLKVLAMSGSLTGDVEQRLCAAGVCRQVIRKPFSGEQLHAAIVACG